MKPLRGKRVGSARSARRIQLGGLGRPGPALADPPRQGGTAARPALGLRRAHFLRGGAPRPAPVRLGRVRGRRWLGRGGSGLPPVLYSAPPPRLRRSPPGPRAVSSAPSFEPLRGREGRGPPLPARASTGADCPQSVSDRAAPPGRGPALVHQALEVRGEVGHPPDPSCNTDQGV